MRCYQADVVQIIMPQRATNSTLRSTITMTTGIDKQHQHCLTLTLHLHLSEPLSDHVRTL